MKKIFITGSEGFIGSHLVEFLVRKEFKVKALVQYNSFNSWGWLETLDKKILRKIEIILGDVRDLNEMIHNTRNQDAIIHLAALIGIPYSYVSPKNYIETNCVGTLNIMQAAKINKVKKVIHTSTSEVYGTAKKIPITEIATPTSFWAFFIFYLNILHIIIIKKNKLLKELTNILS